MSQTIAVIGATGTQGGSVVQSLLKGKSWKIRGITRDISKDAAKALTAQGVEVVSANIDDEESLIKAFEGCQAIFAVTNFWEHLFMGSSSPQAAELELAQGIKIATAASKTSSLKHYVFSTAAGGKETSGGKFEVPHCDAKAAIDEHIIKNLPDLAKKTTFLWVGYYASNLAYFPFTKPNLIASSGKYAWLQACQPDTILPMGGDVSVNIGVYVAAILAHPSVSLPSKYALVQTETITCEDTIKTWGEVTGKEVVYVPVTLQVFESLWPHIGGELATQLQWGEGGYGDWSKLKEGMLSTKDLKIDESELVGLKAYLEGAKDYLL